MGMVLVETSWRPRTLRAVFLLRRRGQSPRSLARVGRNVLGAHPTQRASRSWPASLSARLSQHRSERFGRPASRPDARL